MLGSKCPPEVRNQALLKRAAAAADAAPAHASLSTRAATTRANAMGAQVARPVPEGECFPPYPSETNQQQNETRIAAPNGDDQVVIVTQQPATAPTTTRSSSEVSRKESIVSHEPDMFELETHMKNLKHIYTARFARGILVFSNLVCLVFACLLIYYGAAKGKHFNVADPTSPESLDAITEDLVALRDYALNETGGALASFFAPGLDDSDATAATAAAPAGSSSGSVLQPHQMLMAVGISLLLLSLVGLFGSACPSRRVGKELLFAYFSSVLVFICIMLWASVMCFQYKNEATRFLERSVDNNWAVVKPLFHRRRGAIHAYVEEKETASTRARARTHARTLPLPFTPFPSLRLLRIR